MLLLNIAFALPILSHMWWASLIFPALGVLRSEDREFYLGQLFRHRATPCIKIKDTRQTYITENSNSYCFEARRPSASLRGCSGSGCSTLEERLSSMLEASLERSKKPTLAQLLLTHTENL